MLDDASDRSWQWFLISLMIYLVMLCLSKAIDDYLGQKLVRSQDQVKIDVIETGLQAVFSVKRTVCT